MQIPSRSRSMPRLTPVMALLLLAGLLAGAGAAPCSESTASAKRPPAAVNAVLAGDAGQGDGRLGSGDGRIHVIPALSASPATGLAGLAAGNSTVGSAAYPGDHMPQRVGEADILQPGEDDVTVAVSDPASGYAYFSARDIPGQRGMVIKVRLSDFQRFLASKPDISNTSDQFWFFTSRSQIRERRE